jgi:hypothetical protein
LRASKYSKHDVTTKKFKPNPSKTKAAKVKPVKPQTPQFFDTLKFNGIEYTVGSVVKIHGASYYEFAKILEISRIAAATPVIKIQWFYSWNSLNQLLDDTPDYISKFEIFETNKEETIRCTYLKKPIELLDYDAYGNLTEATADVYFTRANFDPVTHEFNPPTSEWKISCICKKPECPDHNYIGCDNCSQWFHPSCVGFTEE